MKVLALREIVKRGRQARREKKRATVDNTILRKAKEVKSSQSMQFTPLECQGVVTTDKTKWLQQAKRFGKGKFTKSYNSIDDQRRRLDHITSYTRSEEKGGRKFRSFSLFETLQARARFQMDKATDAQGNSTEFLRHLPFEAVVLVHQKFQELYKDRELQVTHPGTWKSSRLSAFPREDARLDQRLGRARWIDRINAWRQWYNRSWLGIYRTPWGQKVVRTYGFQKGHSCEDIVSVLVMAVQKTNKWINKSLVVIISDVATAFGDTDHERLAEANRYMNTDPYAQLGVLRDYTDKTASIYIEVAGDSGEFPFNCGGWAGAVRSPDEYQSNIVYHSKPAVVKWELLEMGYHVDGKMVNPFFWADNKIALATSVQEAQEMVNDLMRSVHSAGYRWKPKSLQCMRIGELRGKDIKLYAPDVHGSPEYYFHCVEQTELLGMKVSNCGRSEPARSWRLEKADGRFYSCIKQLRAKGEGHAAKLEAWNLMIHASAGYGSGMWGFDMNVLETLKNWELNLMRKVFPIQYQPTRAEYLKRSAEHIHRIRTEQRKPYLFQVALANSFRRLYRQQTHKDIFGDVRGKVVGDYRDRLWWVGINHEQCRKRRREGLVQTRAGSIEEPEDFIVELVGTDWKGQLAEGACKAVWMKLCRSKAQEYYRRHRLPLDPRTVGVHEGGVADVVICGTKVGDMGQGERHCVNEGLREEWEGAGNKLRIIVDNLGLQEIVVGKAVYRGETLTPILTRVVERLRDFRMRWKRRTPGGDTSDPIVWRPRELNKRADDQCNVAMDRRCSFRTPRHPKVYELMVLRAHLFVQSDGGCRKGKGSATGWRILAVRPDAGDNIVIQAGGTFFEEDMPSLMVEALALEEVTNVLGGWLEEAELSRREGDGGSKLRRLEGEEGACVGGSGGAGGWEWWLPAVPANEPNMP